MKDGAGHWLTNKSVPAQFFAALPGMGHLASYQSRVGETMIVFVAAGASPNANFYAEPGAQTTATAIIASRSGSRGYRRNGRGLYGLCLSC